MTETQILQELKAQRGQPPRTDHHGFLLSDADAQPAASPSGRGGVESLPTERAVERIRKWRKMLGAAGTELGGYATGARRRAKLKRRWRKGEALLHVNLTSMQAGNMRRFVASDS